MTTADAKVKNQLKAIRDQLQQLRSDRAEAKKDRDAAKEAFGGKEFRADEIIVDSDEFKSAEQAVKKVGEIDDKIADLSTAERRILEMLGNEQSDEHNPSREQAKGRGWDGHEIVRTSEAFHEALKGGLFSSNNHFGTIEIGRISREGFLAAAPGAAPAGDIGTVQGAIVPDVRGIITPALKRVSLLDLIPTGTTDSNIVQYVQVTAIPLSSAETAELALKPEAGLTTVDATAPVRTIAGWIKLARQALDDVAGLGTLMNTLLPYDVRRRLELQVLAGDGAGQNLKGILNTTGIGAPAHVAGDNPADSILRAMTVVILSDSDPNFVTLNPLVAQSLMLMRAGAVDGSWEGQYLYGSPGSLLPPTIWGLTMTQNRIVPQATGLVGDSMGATLLVREGVNIKVSDSDQDDFIRNRVTMLAETRVALPVWRPSAFSIAAFS